MSPPRKRQVGPRGRHAPISSDCRRSAGRSSVSAGVVQPSLESSERPVRRRRKIGGSSTTAQSSVPPVPSGAAAASAPPDIPDRVATRARARRGWPRRRRVKPRAWPASSVRVPVSVPRVRHESPDARWPRCGRARSRARPRALRAVRSSALCPGARVGRTGGAPVRCVLR